MLAGSVDQVARPTQFGELPAAVVGVGLWTYFLVTRGPVAAAELVPLLLIAAGLGAWTLLIRIRFNEASIALTLGPWRRAANLTALESITWKMTGGWRSEGTIFVRDRSGHRVPIYIGRFNRGREWASVLLDAAARTDASVDAAAQHILDQKRVGGPRGVVVH